VCIFEITGKLGEIA